MQSAVSDTAKPVRPRVIKKPVIRRVLADTGRASVIRDSIKTLDSLARRDSLMPTPDTPKLLKNINAKAPRPVAVKRPIDSFYLKMLDNPYLRTTAKPIYLVISERQRQSKDEMFYLVSGILLYLAFIKLVFSKYFNNVFRLFIQPNFRQKQTREQLQQNNLPSLLLNLFFVFSAGAYVSFLIEYYQLVNIQFWFVLLYSTSALLILYLGKYLFLIFAGWVFNVQEATNAYIFSVYLINKIIGVILIPFTLIIAFSKPSIINISITVSLLCIFLLFIYRYIMSYAPVRKEIKVNFFHFLFYILAFEITPLLLIYKTLIIYLNKST